MTCSAFPQRAAICPKCPDLFSTDRPWGASSERGDMGSWHAQNSAVVTVTLTATASDTIANKRLYFTYGYSGIAADSCWQMGSSIHATFWGFFLQLVLLIVWKRGEKNHVLIERFIIEDGLQKHSNRWCEKICSDKVWMYTHWETVW